VSNFFDSHEGAASGVSLNSPRLWIKDWICDLRLAGSRRYREAIRPAGPAQKILVVGVEVPGREADMVAVTARLRNCRHDVDVSVTPMAPQGKFANVDVAIAAAPQPLDAYDWLVITDDDVAIERHFLDHYIALATAADLAISQPAHRFASHASLFVTRRRLGSLVRTSRFVEIGPISVLRRETFAELVPFPETRWCYGVDALWSALAERRGWRMGIVDAAPLRHLRPVARSYDATEAIDEGRRLLERFDVQLTRAEILQSWPLLDA
jgi:hypothetical protein